MYILNKTVKLLCMIKRLSCKRGEEKERLSCRREKDCQELFVHCVITVTQCQVRRKKKKIKFYVISTF